MSTEQTPSVGEDLTVFLLVSKCNKKSAFCKMCFVQVVCVSCLGKDMFLFLQNEFRVDFLFPPLSPPLLWLSLCNYSNNPVSKKLCLYTTIYLWALKALGKVRERYCTLLNVS